MAAPTLYKKKTVAEVNNKPTYDLTAEEKTEVDGIISQFFTLFKAEHT